MIIETEQGDINLHKQAMPEVEFRNVTITIAGCANPRAAYDRLCEMLGAEHVDGVTAEWATDTFVEYDGGGRESEPRSTRELWPAE